LGGPGVVVKKGDSTGSTSPYDGFEYFSSALLGSITILLNIDGVAFRHEFNQKDSVTISKTPLL